MPRRRNKDDEVIGAMPLEEEEEEKKETEEGAEIDIAKIIEPESIIADAPEGTLIHDDEDGGKEDDEDDEESYNPMEDYEDGILG